MRRNRMNHTKEPRDAASEMERRYKYWNARPSEFAAKAAARADELIAAGWETHQGRALARAQLEIKFGVDFERRAAEAEVEVEASQLGERHSRVISQDVKIKVSVRDGGKCRNCGSNEDLHFDHVIPWSKGGTNTVNNIQLLCGVCNRDKGVDDIAFDS
jgi:hypothetical protein